MEVLHVKHSKGLAGLSGIVSSTVEGQKTKAILSNGHYGASFLSMCNVAELSGYQYT